MEFFLYYLVTSLIVFLYFKLKNPEEPALVLALLSPLVIIIGIVLIIATGPKKR